MLSSLLAFLLSYGLGDPVSYMKMLLHLTVGEVTKQREILSTLSKMQYTRNDVTLVRGHFRVKERLSISSQPTPRRGRYEWRCLMTRLKTCLGLTLSPVKS